MDLEKQREWLEDHKIPIEFWPRRVLAIAHQMRKVNNDPPIYSNMPSSFFCPYVWVCSPYLEDPYVTVFGGNKRRYLEEEKP